MFSDAVRRYLEVDKAFCMLVFTSYLNTHEDTLKYLPACVR